MSQRFRLFDFGPYGRAIAWLRGGRLFKVVALETSDKTGGIRTAKASTDLIERVLRALRNR